MHKLEGPILTFIVILLAGIFVFWMNGCRDGEIDLALQRLIEAGYSVDEILQDADFTRLASEKDGLPTNPHDWTQDDIHRAMKLIYESAKKLDASPAVRQVRREVFQRLIVYLKRKYAVLKVIAAFQEARADGVKPMTVDNSLPASVRVKVEEAFGEEADAILMQIEKAFADPDSTDRVLELHGDFEGFANHLLESQSVPADE